MTEKFNDAIFYLMSDNVYDKINQQNTQKISKLNLTPPILERIHPKKFIYSNFDILVNELNTDKNRLFNFFKTNLGNVQYTDEKQTKLNILQKTTDKNIQKLITKYIESFVVCIQCRSYNTHIIQESNIFKFMCKDCHANRFIV